MFGAVESSEESTTQGEIPNNQEQREISYPSQRNSKFPPASLDASQYSTTNQNPIHTDVHRFKPFTEYSQQHQPPPGAPGYGIGPQQGLNSTELLPAQLHETNAQMYHISSRVSGLENNNGVEVIQTDPLLHMPKQRSMSNYFGPETSDNGEGLSTPQIVASVTEPKKSRKKERGDKSGSLRNSISRRKKLLAHLDNDSDSGTDALYEDEESNAEASEATSISGQMRSSSEKGGKTPWFGTMSTPKKGKKASVKGKDKIQSQLSQEIMAHLDNSSSDSDNSSASSSASPKNEVRLAEQVGVEAAHGKHINENIKKNGRLKPEQLETQKSEFSRGKELDGMNIDQRETQESKFERIREKQEQEGFLKAEEQIGIGESALEEDLALTEAAMDTATTEGREEKAANERSSTSTIEKADQDLNEVVHERTSAATAEDIEKTLEEEQPPVDAEAELLERQVEAHAMEMDAELEVEAEEMINALDADVLAEKSRPLQQEQREEQRLLNENEASREQFNQEKARTAAEAQEALS